MTKIKREKERFFVKYKVSILVAIGLIASISSGYAAVQYYQLKSPQGEVLYLEKDVKESGAKTVKEPDQEMDAFLNKRWEIEDNMEPGTVAAVYIVPHNPQKQIVTMTAPFEYMTLADVQKKVGDQIFLPETLPGGHAFLDARFEFGIKNEYDKAALYQKAEKEKKEYVMQPLAWTNELEYLYTTYQSGKSYINLNITNYEGVQESTTYEANLDQQKKEVVKVGQIEVLYTEEAKKDQTDKSIVWVVEYAGKKMQYEVVATGDVLTKSKISEFVNAMMPKK
ncbi:hypothetical protein C7R93_08635 [Brevibacillus fortis]|uniref:DUF4367 domain-containing protein n=2 Tax=Brevibacillus fortis TaxID=2126352 RepID=A0A2P7VDU0_9BACL|nr:hypothetical protein C7R93_08635 [Brevibacillus fortis]